MTHFLYSCAYTLSKSLYKVYSVQLESKLAKACVTGLTRSHVPVRFDVLDLCSRSSRDTYVRDTYARTPTTPIYTSFLAHGRLFFIIQMSLYQTRIVTRT